MDADTVRPLVIGIPSRDDEIFVSKLSDPGIHEQFFRPIGGEIEFAEYSRDALVREFDEELNISVTVGEYLGSIENVFEFAGRTRHEIVFVYDIEPMNELWNVTQLEGKDDGGVTYTASWKSVAQFGSQETPLYPNGLMKLLQSDTKLVTPRN